MTAVPGDRLIRGARTKGLLALACVAVLVIGWLLSPRERPRRVAETVAPILETEVQRREPARLFQGVREAGLRAVPYTVAFLPAAPLRPGTVADFAAAPAAQRAPSGFGLVVSAEGEVLSHLDALGGARTATATLPGGAPLGAEVVAYEPETGLVLVKLPLGPRAELPARAADRAAPGSPAIAVGHIDGLEFVAPVFIAAARGDGYVLTGAGGTLLPGMPVVDIDGNALAVTAAGAAPVRAYAIGAAVARLRQLLARGRGLPRTIGVALQELRPELAQRVGPGAAIIADVERRGPADQAGLRPGDVLLAIGAHPLRGLEAALDAIATLPPAAPAAVAVRRGERELSVNVLPRLTLEKPGRPAFAAPGDEGPRASEVFPAAVLRRGGLQPDALVLAVAGSPTATAAQAVRALRQHQGPVLVRLRQDGRAFFVVVEPAA